MLLVPSTTLPQLHLAAGDNHCAISTAKGHKVQLLLSRQQKVDSGAGGSARGVCLHLKDGQAIHDRACGVGQGPGPGW